MNRNIKGKTRKTERKEEKKKEKHKNTKTQCECESEENLRAAIKVEKDSKVVCTTKSVFSYFLNRVYDEK